jgi:glycosyltransferase involved in cell wall biosynthesis
MLAAECDVYLQTSVFEGLSLAVLEAQALGLPAVVTDVPGNRSAVSHQATGFVSFPDIKSLADSLELLAKDMALRDRMGSAARTRIEQKFTEQRLLDDFEKLYKNISSGNVLPQGS